MKTFLTLSLLLTGICFPLSSQETNAPVTPEAAEKKKKPDIKELMELPAFTNSTGMVMVKISPAMWAGKFEVTQEEYQKVAGSNPSKFGGTQNPVDSVGWNDAKHFCQKLVEAEKQEEMLPEGYTYRLPTEAEWQSLVGNASLKDAVTSERGSRSGTAPVGSLGANNLGLHDTRGNVWEWCQDDDGKAYRVLRGGAWNTSYEPSLRLEFRLYSNGPDDRQNNYGFRCLLVPDGK